MCRWSTTVLGRDVWLEVACHLARVLLCLCDQQQSLYLERLTGLEGNGATTNPKVNRQGVPDLAEEALQRRQQGEVRQWSLGHLDGSRP